jgi:hypothetical protein
LTFINNQSSRMHWTLIMFFGTSDLASFLKVTLEIVRMLHFPFCVT